MDKVLIVEDNIKLSQFYSNILIKEEYITKSVKNSTEFFETYSTFKPDLVILDIKLNKSVLNGLEIYQKLIQNNTYNPKIIVLSGEATRSEIAQAMQLGAYTFIEKSGEFDPDKFLSDIKQALNLKRQEESNITLKKEYEALRSTLIATQPLLGNSDQMQKVKERITKFAKADIDVLIIGETGTGKEVVANNLYWQSRRVGKPFVKVNAGGLPDTLIDSELFGHKKGSFTSASSDKKGVFEEAEGGTLFLDEIANLSMTTQAKILRAIENKEVKIVGGKTIKIDVRLIFACNRELQQMISDHKFRNDLYYRLEGNIIHLPPLRERDEDIIILMDHFLETYQEKYKRKLDVDLNKLKDLLMIFNWPGNVRELEKFCEYLFVIHKEINNKTIIKEFENKRFGNVHNTSSNSTKLLEFDNYQDAIDSFEKQYFTNQLKKVRNKVADLAEKIGLDKSTIYKKCKKLNIKI